jgi:hypothetical protein
MKRLILILLAAVLSSAAFAQKSEIVKTGINIGPLPAVAFDADKGFQYGAILNIYDYGDGSNYPNYDSKWYLEASFFTKGSQLYTVSYDNKELIPGVRWSSTVTTSVDKAFDFYGFNGYMSYYDYERIAVGKENKTVQDPSKYLYSPFYKVARISVLGKTDFVGNITPNFKWEAGYHISYFKEGEIDRENVNKGKDDYNKFPGTTPTLFEIYRQLGLISDEEAGGGLTSSVRLGLTYDTRDKEGAPSRGVWAEGHVTAAPKWLGTSNPHYRYSLTFRHYLPIVKNDVLTLAYRLNYEGTIGSNAPYYVLPYLTVMGDYFDRDGMGGYRTVRGMMRDRVVGLDMATYNAELRWRFTRFQMFNQNIALGLSAFSDGTMVTRGRDMKTSNTFSYGFISPSKIFSSEFDKDKFHVTVGAGFRFIMNENFIVAVEYGTPVSRFVDKSNPIHGQDGTGALYINTGYLF